MCANSRRTKIYSNCTWSCVCVCGLARHSSTFVYTVPSRWVSACKLSERTRTSIPDTLARTHASRKRNRSGKKDRNRSMHWHTHSGTRLSFLHGERDLIRKWSTRIFWFFIHFSLETVHIEQPMTAKGKKSTFTWRTHSSKWYTSHRFIHVRRWQNKRISQWFFGTKIALSYLEFEWKTSCVCVCACVYPTEPQIEWRMRDARYETIK